MQNIEIKYRLADSEGVINMLDQDPPIKFVFRRRQTDHYFDVKNGRCKLRIEDDTPPLLIRYNRADVSEARVSNFDLEPVDDAEETIRRMTAEFGHLITVCKKRHLYRYKNVRIHLDEVENLGNFTELESMIIDGFDQKSAQHNFDQALKKVSSFLGKIQSKSYQNLLMERKDSPEKE